MNSTSGQLHSALSENFPNLSPQLQQAARYILDNPEDVATRSLRQVAHLSGLTPPTFSRLARAIGFGEYEELKDVCRSELKRNSMTLAQRASILQQKSGVTQRNGESFADQHVSASINNIAEFYQKLDLDYLADVVEHLAVSKEVFLLGSLSSRAVLEYLHHMVSLAKPGWTVLNENQLPASTLLAEVDVETVILVISLQPYIHRTVQITELAKKSGATVIAITDDISSPILEHSDRSFLVPTESPQFFPSYVAVLTFLEILSGMLVRRWGNEANRRIEGVEKTRYAIGDYI